MPDSPAAFIGSKSLPLSPQEVFKKDRRHNQNEEPADNVDTTPPKVVGHTVLRHFVEYPCDRG